MPQYTVLVRHLDDRPTPSGYPTAPVELPRFRVVARNPADAATLAHRITGNGGHTTRTTVDVDELDGATTPPHISTRYATGWSASRVARSVVRVVFLFHRCGVLDTSVIEHDADRVTVLTEDGTVFADLHRTTRGRWHVSHAAGAAMPAMSHLRRFATPHAAAGYVAARAGVNISDAYTPIDQDRNAAEFAMYRARANAMVRLNHVAIAQYLTTACPECGGNGTDYQHTLTVPDVGGNQYLLVGCTGYWVVNPNAVGIESPNWSPPLTDVPWR